MLLILWIIVAVVASYLTLQVPDSMSMRRGLLGALYALLFLVIIQKWLISKGSKARGEKLTLFDLIVTSEDNRFSLSRLQMYMWTAWVVIAFAAIVFAIKKLPDHFPTNLAALMGINGFAAALSTATTDLKKAAANRADKPSFFDDLFLDKNKTLDLPRTQMFVWTLVILTAHIFLVTNDYIAGTYKIQDIDNGLLILMGVSNGAYLGAKAAIAKQST